MELASSFPCGRTLVLRCAEAAREGWPERLASFVARNHGALGQLQQLDLGLGPGAGVLTSAALAAIAQLPSLQSLIATVSKHPPAGRRWAT